MTEKRLRTEDKYAEGKKKVQAHKFIPKVRERFIDKIYSLRKEHTLLKFSYFIDGNPRLSSVLCLSKNIYALRSICLIFAFLISIGSRVNLAEAQTNLYEQNQHLLFPDEGLSREGGSLYIDNHQAPTFMRGERRLPPSPDKMRDLLSPKNEPLLIEQTKIRVVPNSTHYPIKIKVKKIVFKGNTVFSDQQLQAILTPYQNQEISLSELFQARVAITKLYVDHGYITSGAYLPVTENQVISPNGGVVVIQIVEGKLEGINVSGTLRLQEYVRSRLRKATSPILNSKRLIEALQLLQINPLIEKISAELNQGSGFGKAVLNVRVKARQPLKAEIILDNSRSPAVGSFQRRLLLTDANLLGLGDKLTVGYRNTDGSNAVEADYSVPINSQNGTIEFGYINVSSSIIKYPFNKLDILSNARAYELTFRQPLLQQALSNASREFALGLTASRQESETSLLNTPFPLSPGADEQGRTRISALRFFQEWTQRNNQQVFFTRSQFSLGIGAFNSTSQFFSWRGQIELLKRLGDVSLLLRGNLQLADRSLAPLEQFGLGGVATVRGYSQDALLTDNGFLLSTEVHIPVKIGEYSELQVIPFADVGTAWNNNGTREPTNTSKSGTLASFGLGIEYQLGERLNARLDWGIPLVPFATSKSNSWQENGLYFFIRYKLL